MSEPSDLGDLRRRLGLSQRIRVILCAGEFVRRNRFRDALWTLDILKYIRDDLVLLLAGDGPERPRLEQFVQDMNLGEQVRLLGVQEDLTPFFAVADVVWIPGPSRDIPRFALAALAALAAGRPVVAARSSGMEACLQDGVTGFLVPPDDKIALAKRTRLLLENDQLRRRLSAAGAAHVRENFAHLHR